MAGVVLWGGAVGRKGMRVGKVDGLEGLGCRKRGMQPTLLDIVQGILADDCEGSSSIQSPLK